MSQRELDPRKELILKVVTDDYIESAEPVGSRTIARKYNLGLSPQLSVMKWPIWRKVVTSNNPTSRPGGSLPSKVTAITWIC